LDPSRCLFVGDRLDTDIRFGNENGMKFYLAMTGVTTAKTLIGLGQGSEQEPLPDFILPHEGMLIQMSDVSEPLFSDASFS
jgi:ribonucleotide monophosphatase NagD (HAD superfamily)